MHGLDSGEVLVDDFVERPAALVDVAANAADESNVRVGIDEDLDVADVTDTSVAEQQNAIDDHDLGRWNDHGAVAPGVADEIVHGLFDRLTRREARKLSDKEL